MHTLDTAICMTAVLLILAVLLWVMPVPYTDLRNLAVGSARAEVMRLSRDRLLQIRWSQTDPPVPVVSGSPERMREWIGLADEAVSWCRDAIRELAGYFGDPS